MIFLKKNQKFEGTSTLAPQSSGYPKMGLCDCLSAYDSYQNGDFKIGRAIVILSSENVRSIWHMTHAMMTSVKRLGVS